MATIVNRRRGTQAQHAAFTGAVGETTYDTDRKTLVAHDGATVGGFVVAAPHISNTFTQPQTIDAVLNMNSHLINNVTNPVGPQDAATKAYSDAGDVATLVAAAPPFTDTLPLIKGSVTATKLLRFEVDGFTAATTRVLTPPDADITLAGINISQIFAATQTITPAANTENLILSGGSLTGANAQSALDISGTWNTAGDPAGIKLNITNTASGASALLLDLQRDGLSRMTVRKSGFQTLLRQEADVNISGLEISKRGNAGSATGALSSGSGIGGLDFRGYDGVAFAGAGSLRSFTTQAWAAGAHGSSFVFSLVPIGSTVETAVATLSGAGGLTLTGQLLLPNTTSATVGGIYFGGNRFVHNFGTSNTFVGNNAGNFTLTGINNAFFGFQSGGSVTSGGGNSFFGFFSGVSTTSGNNNCFFGLSAGYSNTTGATNAFVGHSAGRANLGGSNNVFFGYQTGYSNTSGTDNAFVGLSAGRLNTTGSSNTFFGSNSGRNTISGSNNTFFGVNSGYLNTGANNIFFGYQAGNNLTTGSNNIVFGYDIDSPTATNSNTLTIGNLIFGTGVDGTGTTISSGGVGIRVITPTARVHISAGTTAASTAPLKFNTGTSMTAAEAGAVEFTTDDLFFTITTGAARKRLLLADPTAGLTSTRVPFATTNGRLTDAAGFSFAGTTLTVANITQSTAGLFSITSGANQRAGNLTLIGGTLTVANTTVTANTIVMLTRKTSGGTIGTAITYTVIAATSFTVTSDSALDTSTFSYMLIEVP